jgi:hypothetical protein
MASERADDQFSPHEEPTRPGNPPRTRTGKWRAVTSAALERGFGRLSDGDFDQGQLPESPPVPTMDPGADESGTRPVSAIPTPTPAALARRLNATVRMPVATGERGPTGTLRIPKRRRVLDATLRIPRMAARRRSWRAVVVIALVACAMVALLVEHVPATQSLPPVDPVFIPPPLQATEVPAPPAEALVQSPDPPLAPTTKESRPLKSRPAARGRKAPRTGSAVF